MKSWRLYGLYKVYQQKGAKCVLINYKADTRYGENLVSTHKDSFGNQIQAKALCCSDLNEIRDVLFEAQVIAIDEIQFFPDCVALVRELLKEGKKLFIAGLDADFQQQPFPGSCLPELIPLALRVEKLYAICDFCPEGTKYHKAPMSWRTDASTETQVIGSSEKYGAICHRCLALPVKVRRPSSLTKSA